MLISLANSPANVEIYNQVRRAKGLTRSELAERTGLARSTISIQVNDLIKKGLLVEEENGEALRKLRLQITADKGYFCGGMLGTKRFSFQVLDMNYQSIYQNDLRLESIAEPHSCNKKILEFLQKCIQQSGIAPEQILGLGLGFPFPLNFTEGRPDSPPYIPLWDNFPLKDYYQRELGLPVLIDNDVNVMAWGELVHQPNLEDTLFIKLGTGIGCGIVLNQQIYRGAQGAAGDIGHIRVPNTVELCHCGHVGCLEAVAGGPALLRAAQKLVQEKASPYLAEVSKQPLGRDAIIAGSHVGDLACTRLLQDTGEKIGDVLAGLISAFNPDTIIIGGGLSLAGMPLLNSIRQRSFYRAPHLATMNLRIQLTADPAWGGAVGAAALIGEHMFLHNFEKVNSV